MWFGHIEGDTHQDRLESFYQNQAELYDGYRARMLHARKPMMTRLMVWSALAWQWLATGAVRPAMHTEAFCHQVERQRKGEVVWVDLGGGTGANVEFMSSAIDAGWFKQVGLLFCH
jgi:betaine lipid synthase